MLLQNNIVMKQWAWQFVSTIATHILVAGDTETMTLATHILVVGDTETMTLTPNTGLDLLSF